MPRHSFTAGLEAHCESDRERAILSAVREAPTIMRAGAALGISERAVYRNLQKIKDRARAEGWEEIHFIPEGHALKGMSTLVRDGEAVLTWVKTREDAELKDRLLQEARQALVDGLPREKAVKPPKAQPDDLLDLYILTDYHLGMKAWHEETGADWDIRIAEDLLVAWFTAAIKDAPRAKTALFAQLGDFMHWDGIEAVTPTNRHILDADTRHQKMVRVAIRATRRIIRALLKKHEQVHIVMAEGNHDPAASAWLREMLSEFYGDEPRITVDRSPDPFYCYEHGLTSLFFHHGHKRRINAIDDVFVSKFREVFGRTRYSYGHMGHLHHDKVLETNLMHVEQHRMGKWGG